MTYNIIAKDDTVPENTLCICLDIITDTAHKIPEFAKTAVKNACREFIETPAGKHVFEHNCENFNWGDLINEVPEAICEKHGFRILRCIQADEIVNIDEQLY